MESASRCSGNDPPPVFIFIDDVWGIICSSLLKPDHERFCLQGQSLSNFISCITCIKYDISILFAARPTTVIQWETRGHSSH